MPLTHLTEGHAWVVGLELLPHAVLVKQVRGHVALGGIRVARRLVDVTRAPPPPLRSRVRSVGTRRVSLHVVSRGRD